MGADRLKIDAGMPATPRARHLTPAEAPAPLRILELQHLAGNLAVARSLATGAAPPGTPPVQRDDKTPKQRVEQALTEGKPDLVAGLDAAALAVATADERLRMIDILNDQGSGFQRLTLPKLWDTFGAQLRATAEGNAARWKKSFAVAGSAMRGGANVSGVRHVFYFDVQDVAKSYLDVNENYIGAEFERLGLTETGDVKTGPPTAQQASALADTRDQATKLAADQEAMLDLRKIIVGYSWVEYPPGGAGEPVATGGPADFDPERPPSHGPLKTDKSMKTWQEVKTNYDQLDTLVRARLMCNPNLFPLARDAHEDTSKTKKVSTGTDTEAMQTVGDGLKAVKQNIAKTRPLLKVLAPDLEPVQGQLIAGTRQAAPDRNWKTSPFYAEIAADIVAEHQPGPWWQSLGLAAAEMGAYVVAGLATGGTALAIGLAAKGVMNTALAGGKAQAMEAAYGATTTEELSLITAGQVDAAKAAVIESAAFALLDVVFAATGIRSVLREVLQYEKVAAESAARAAVAADKWMLKELQKDARAAMVTEAKAALPQVQAEVDAASKAVTEARSAAANAASEEASRTAVALKRAEEAEGRAKGALEDTKAAAAGKFKPKMQVNESEGLGTKAAYDATVKAAKQEIGAAWKTMTAAERQAKVVKVVQDRMQAAGIPGFSGVTLTPGKGGAAANWRNWELTIDPALLDGSHSMESIVGLIYHEAAHFEDFVRVARLKLGEGMSPSQIQALTGIDSRGIQAAVARGPMTAAAAEYTQTKAIFESVWGTGAGHRNFTYQMMADFKTHLGTAEAQLWTVIDKNTKQLLPGKTAADLQNAASNVQLFGSQYQIAVAEYMKLPEEVRAYGIQGSIGMSFEAADLRRRIALIAAAVAAIIGAGAAASVGLKELSEK